LLQQGCVALAWSAWPTASGTERRSLLKLPIGNLAASVPQIVVISNIMLDMNM
jgi:hypothetical protein